MSQSNQIAGSDLPLVTSGPFDSVIGVDESTGALRRFPVPSAEGIRGYATLGNLQSDLSPPPGTLAYVVHDAVVANNGLYRKSGASGSGEWVISADRVTGLEQYVATVFRKSPLEPILIVSDPDGNIAATIEADGGLYLPGLEDSVQEEILEAGSRTQLELAAEPEDIFAVADANGALTMRQDGDGGLHLPGLKSSVQDAILEAAQQAKDTSLAQTRTYRDTFSPAALAVASTREQSATGAFAPLPFGLLPQNYALGLGWLDALSTTQPSRTIIETPYRADDGVVHPNVIEFYNGFRGYRYWMVLTPYYNTNDIYENPVVYGSNDLASWDMLDGFEQPLAGKPPGTGDHLADCGWAYDPRSGELICYWRATYRNAATTNVTTNESLYRATKDGFSWSEPRTLYPNVGLDDEAQRSLAVLFDPLTSLWHFYATHGTGLVRHRTARSIEGPWSAPTNIPIPAGIVPWHLEVKFVGDKVAMLIHDDTSDNLFFGISADWVTWTFGTTPVLTGTLSGVYKASFVPRFNETGELAMDMIWTSDQSGATADDKWRFFHNTTNYVAT